MLKRVIKKKWSDIQQTQYKMFKIIFFSFKKLLEFRLYFFTIAQSIFPLTSK